MKKRIASLALALAMVMTFAACGSATPTASPGSGNAAPAEKENFNPTGYPIVNEPITLKVGIMKAADHGDFKEMEIFKQHAARTNINIEFIEIPQQNFQENLNLMLSSGEYPDVFYGRGMDNAAGSYERMYGPSGVFMELTDLVNEYAPNIKKMFAEEEISYKKSLVDGKLYSIPKITHNPHMKVEDKWYINQKWLDKVGKKVPTTTDELYDVLKAFRDEDPNDNGKKDEVPFTTWVGYYGMGSLYGSWGVVDNQFNHMMVTGGKLSFAPSMEGYRQGLEYWIKLYSEGLLGQETFTMTNEQLCALGQTPDVTLGSYIRHVGDYVVGKDRYFDYTHVAPLKAPNGVEKPLWKNTEYPFYYGSTFIITNKCQYPRESIRWVDYTYDTQGFIEFDQGPENLTWKWTDDKKHILKIPAPEGVDGNDWRNGNAPGGYSAGWFPMSLNEVILKDPDDPYTPIVEDFEAHSQLYWDFQPKEYVPTLSFSNAESEELSLIQSTIFNYAKESEGKFITGQMPLTDWDTYLKTLNDMGLPRLVEIYQAAYDRLMKG